MVILGIETSCDETAAAVIFGNKEKVKVLSNVVSSQIEIHKKYGGVVPEVAAREHVLNILPVINEALEKAGIKRKDAKKKIDAIAVTTGPGLITSLQVGVETAKVLSYVWKIPAVAVNHIEGHIYANFITPQTPLSKGGIKGVKFPALILTVSGGHTMLVLMKGHGQYKVIGETVDDAAGEAFDKAAQILNIGYPGGPAISKYTSKWKSKILNSKSEINPKSKIQNSKNKSQIANRKSSISLPRPMIYSKDYNFSFSGLKTALLYKIQKDPDWKKRIPEYCFEFQQAVIDVLIHKTIKAAKNYKVHPVKSGKAGAKQFNGVKTIMLSGGVSANLELRDQMAKQIKELLSGFCFLLPDLKYTTDNAAMIATAGYFKTLRKEFTPPLRKRSGASWQKLRADCNLEF
jgi:N6-L-threonylcarbamoyladenine synthase